MNLTNSEHDIFTLLQDGEWHSYEDIFAVVYRSTPEDSWPDTNVIKVFICNLRKKTGAVIVSGRQRYKMGALPRQAVAGDIYETGA